jgi:predicted GNAT family acetyltransferase
MTESPNPIEQPTILSPLSFAAHLTTARLAELDQPEVLRFLAEQPLHNVVMSGLIRDHGIESKLNRGAFYGCRNGVGELEGVALIGHAVFIDARSDEALRQFAELTQQYPRAHMLMGEQELIERFWNYYAPNGQPRHRLCREVLFELDTQSTRIDHVANLRVARISDLARVAPIHATMAFEESGVNPLQIDPDGFRERCRRRIEERRTWVLIEQDELIFKADVISETPEVFYIEGVYVHPEHRGQGHGSRCLAQLTQLLLHRTRAISLLVNQERRQAQQFFKKLGFVSRGIYETIFLRTQPENF